MKLQRLERVGRDISRTIETSGCQKEDKHMGSDLGLTGYKVPTIARVVVREVVLSTKADPFGASRVVLSRHCRA